jgi:ribosomal RNA-processing protein 36
VLTSKKPVTRKREVVPVPFVKARDPRFDPALGTFNEAAFSKNYGFLDEYKESEAAAMKDRLKKIKDNEEKEKIKKELAVIENQKKAKKRKEEREAILREHKRKERELVKQGKKPFFLKKCKPSNLILGAVDSTNALLQRIKRGLF